MIQAGGLLFFILLRRSLDFLRFVKAFETFQHDPDIFVLLGRGFGMEDGAQEFHDHQRSALQ